MTKRSCVRNSAGEAGEFSSPGSTFCADSYFSIRFTPMLPQWHIKDPSHSAKSAGGRLQLNTHASYGRCFAWSDIVHGCMVYAVCAEMAARGTSHASAVSTPLRWIFKKTLWKAINSCRITCDLSESARERRIALYKSDQQQCLWLRHS